MFNFNQIKMRRHYPRITKVYHNPHSPQKRLRISARALLRECHGSFICEVVIR